MALPRRYSVSYHRPAQESICRENFVAKMYRGMKSDARALAAYVKLLRAGESALAEATRPLALYNLSPIQFVVLEALGEGGPQSLENLGRRVLRGSSDLDGVVANLSKRSLVRRKPVGGRNRQEMISIAPKGRILLRSILPGYATAVVAVMSRLSAREQESLGAVCSKLSAGAARKRSAC
jgi:MarR family 2-MHQ and catechol resistance regulon transcriptional repressor